MSVKATLGQTGMIPGPKKAHIFPKPAIAAMMMKRAKRCLLVVGSKAPLMKTNDGNLVDSAIRISKKGNISVATTGHTVSEFLKRGSKCTQSIQVMNLGDRLRDPSWEGFDGGGPYDLVVFTGFPYYIEWLVQSGLKNFAPDLRTISLEETYQPNASWSLGMLPKGGWEEAIDEILNILEEEKS
jgi:acetyl-CoA decarbonylase/synthase complex subunit epsilon